MMKYNIYILFLLVQIFSCCKMCATTSYEYTRDKDCIYACNIGTYEATVVNFCTTSEDITIPSHIIYDGDIYTVVGISYNKFTTSYSNASLETLGESMLLELLGLGALATATIPSSFSKVEENEKILKELGLSTNFDFNGIRSRIKFLKIPNTIKHIGSKAFWGMTRLQTCTIPEGVTISPRCFNDENKRLKHLTLLGAPCQYQFSKPITPENTDYLKELASYLDVPDYTIIHYPEYEKWKQEQKQKHDDEIRALVAKYQVERKDANARISEVLTYYNRQWRTYPYNIGCPSDSLYHVQILSTGTEITSIASYDSVCKELLKCEQEIKHVATKRLQTKKDSVYEIYLKNPEVFIQHYLTAYPEIAPLWDNLSHEYRCYNKRDIFSYMVEQKLDSIKLVPCRKSQYKKYAHLYASQDEFDQWYDKGEEDILMNDISQRDVLREFSTFMEEKGTKINLQTEECLETQKLKRYYLNKLKNTPYYKSALELLLSNKRFAKEWKKNGHLFPSLEAFYIAYINFDYRRLLRDKKREIQL